MNTKTAEITVPELELDPFETLLVKMASFWDETWKIVLMSIIMSVITTYILTTLFFPEFVQVGVVLTIAVSGLISGFVTKVVTVYRKMAQKRNEQLSDWAVQLRELNQRLAESNADLEAFAHTVAHDLKTPITGIIGFAELLKMQLKQMEAENDSLFYTVGKITGSSQKMVNIIDELLLLASIGQSKIETHPLDMGTIVGQVQDRLTSMIDEYQAEIILPASWPTAQGYAAWIEEIWANYLSNALKYGGTPPKVELGATLLDNHMIQFWIQDDGQGMPLEAQARLFQEFTRLEEHKKLDGHGLGLSIVRRIAEKLGGSVGVHSKLGQGSRFYFNLPTSKA